MIHRTALLTVALIGLLPSIARAGDAAAGKHAFVANNCYLCHGTVGQGGAGPTIAPPKLMPSLDAFIAWVRKPGAGNMPVYTAKVLSDADLTSIYAYLSSLHAPTAIPAVLTHP
jgi:ubiquinol-cytochrome c reductase cytochrome c subunit